MKVNPEYLSFTAYQSNYGTPILVVGAVAIIVALCLSVLVVAKSQNDVLAEFMFILTTGVFIAIAAFTVGSSMNQQIKGNIQEIEAATGAQIISIGVLLRFLFATGCIAGICSSFASFCLANFTSSSNELDCIYNIRDT